MKSILTILGGAITAGVKVTKGVVKGLEEGFEELGQIPANIRFQKKDRLSGRYKIDLPYGESVTITFRGGTRSWDIDEFCGRPISDEDWEKLSDSKKSEIHRTVNLWASALYEKHGVNR